MNPRWTSLMGRAGSVLLVVGAVLAMVAVTPPAPTGYMSSTGASLGPRKYHANPYTRVYSPTAGLRLVTSSNDSLRLYLVEVDFQNFMAWAESWIRDNHPELDENRVIMSVYNSTVLEHYLESYPQRILIDQEISGEAEIDYFPTSPTNVTAYFSNPSDGWVDLDLRLSGISGLVPRENITLPTLATIALGFLLVLPWIGRRRWRS